jgi:hypothetical protein
MFGNIFKKNKKMKTVILSVFFFVVFTACAQPVKQISDSTNKVYQIIDTAGLTVASRILPPEGFNRVEIESESFAFFLRNFNLKPHGTKVLLYNGKEKPDQSIHIAVLDIDAGNRDLQQCADAVMRLRAEYLFSKERYSEIGFNFVSDGKARYLLDYTKGDTSYKSYRQFMDYVFSFANTRSLHHQLHAVENFENMSIGNVLIQTRNPYGHAVIVVDMLVNESTGEKLYLLAQSYMPAQDIHILRNPLDKEISPWYRIDSVTSLIYTPEWVFKKEDLREF